MILLKINQEKLNKYLSEEKIIEFNSDEECLEYFNTYDYQNFKTVTEMKKFQGEYGFNIGNRRFHINYDEALDVWEDELSELFIVNSRQHYFLKEIERLNYNRDEAYAAIINSKNRYDIVQYWLTHLSQRYHFLCSQAQRLVVSLTLNHRRKPTVGRADPPVVPVTDEISPK